MRSSSLFKGGEWHTTRPKTKKSDSVIAVTPALVKGLEDHRRRQLKAWMKAGKIWADHGFIFTDEAGEPFRGRTMKRLSVLNGCSELGILVDFAAFASDSHTRADAFQFFEIGKSNQRKILES